MNFFVTIIDLVIFKMAKRRKFDSPAQFLSALELEVAKVDINPDKEPLKDFR